MAPSAVPSRTARAAAKPPLDTTWLTTRRFEPILIWRCAVMVLCAVRQVPCGDGSGWPYGGVLTQPRSVPLAYRHDGSRDSGRLSTC